MSKTIPRRVGSAIIAGLLGFLLGAAKAAANAGLPVYQGGAHDFAAVHGERALMMGYGDGLEVWAYPLQLLSGYRVRFHVTGVVQPLDGATLLRRIEYHAAELVRVYVGPDFVVREHLFVPRQAAAAVLRYEVEGRPEVRIEASFRPSLDLMWPGALGGQSVGWDTALGAYVEREPVHGFTAAIASPETVEHDAIVNRTRPVSDKLSLVLKPRGGEAGVRTATLYVLGQVPASAQALTALEAERESWEREALAHAVEVRASGLQVETPDAAVNDALASAVLALDQAWACAPSLGCGSVAGYGPSRPGRRPQYAWFFAGDGLVAMQGMLAASQYSRAREELAFIARYQNAKTGMIWHEISQSAPLIDWERRYPYMFVHVDITFQYLAGVAEYVRTTGDTRFVRDHWAGIAAAWRYCLSTIGRTGLPEIPPGKSGQNEQDRLRDDIRLSTVWIDAATGYAELARVMGHAGEAADAGRRAALSRRTIAAQGWDEARGFWLSGHTLDGAPVHAERTDPVGILTQNVFSAERANAVLDRLASPEFTTDWGARSLSARAPDYDPNLYGSGSVWATGTAAVATSFWALHRPLTGWALWRSLAAWNTLDSAGHLHELVAGDVYHAEVESVPEQTWSSAALLTSAAQGLLGLEARPGERRLGFAPHLPAEWDRLALRNVAIGANRLGLRLIRDPRGIDLFIDNPGEAVDVDFAPEIALGAQVRGASVDGIAAAARAEHHAQDDHARLLIHAHHGETRAHIDLAGGVTIRVPAQMPAIGDHSGNLKIVSARYVDRALVIDAWVLSAARTSVSLATMWRPASVEGAHLGAVRADGFDIAFDLGGPVEDAGRRVRAVIHFAAGR